MKASKLFGFVKSAFILYFTDNIILLFNSSVPLFICVNVGDEKDQQIRLVKSLAISCWEGKHKVFSLLVATPLMAFFGLLIPSFLAAKIYKSMKKEDSPEKEKFLQGFEKFTLPYKNNRGFYGVLLIFNKIIVVFLKGFVTGMIISGNILTILLIVIFYLLIYYLVLYFV